jgi:Pyruvate/2-oxoacid:ferredoxin oxidoreductase gamma subunit
VLSPASPHPDVLIAFNAPSLTKFAGTVRAGGTIIYDSSVIDAPPPMPPGVSAHGVPMTRIAADLGKPVVKNIVALGALQGATGIFPTDTFLTAIRQALKDKCALIPLNEEAFEWGRKSVASPTM